ncbi:MAG TPA: OmpH family outer membrane protein [Chitinophagaceae bacterium]|nr:OmpH family outer membrane protein [Chitinophagaceae bacterium]
MKNGLLIWNVLLTLTAGYLVYNHFSSKKGSRNADPKSGITNNRNNDFRMAYFEMDSVAANFDLVKEVKTELTKKEEEIATEMDRLAKKIQDKYAYYQNLAQAGNLSESQSEAASIEIKKMDDDMKARKQQLDQDYFDLKTRKETDIKTKIENFCNEYNATHNYTYIISYEQGLFFYKDTAYNITSDLVKGLNAKYRPEKKK